MNPEETGKTEDATAAANLRLFVTWIVTSIVFYGVLSGLLIWLLPFSFFAQYSLVIHTGIGVVSILPLVGVTWLHMRSFRLAAGRKTYLQEDFSAILLIVCLLSGCVITWKALFGTGVPDIWIIAHRGTGLLLAATIIWHLISLYTQGLKITPKPTGSVRRKVMLTCAVLIIALTALALPAALMETEAEPYQPFAENYDWRFGSDLPFAPSRATLQTPPWEAELESSLRQLLDDDAKQRYQEALANLPDNEDGAINRTWLALNEAGLDPGDNQLLSDMLDKAVDDIGISGAANAAELLGAEGCGSSGCHEQIYEEWLPSAHGFAASDSLFLAVQALAATSLSTADTRACAGCHDPVALLAGERDDKGGSSEDMTVHEGISCTVCHSIVSTDAIGNGGYVMQIPQHYLFHNEESGLGQLINYFLIRSYPQHHVATYKRSLYKESEYCAACHVLKPAPGTSTTAGLAQEQNEYDSWRDSPWYHEEEPERTIECRECHMPLVDSTDPARGDDIDSYRSKNDGKHRSHRALGSNMYIPVTDSIPGGQQQADETVAWLRGEIEIPEIEEKWATGSVVEIDIVGPEQVAPGELINLTLNLHNNKTGHAFPAGPLDVLESWVELIVTDDKGRVILELGAENSANPDLDTPVVYKADWYDSRGLPVEQHDLWRVVGASYKHVLESGGDDIVDIPFRCPSISRPRLSQSASEAGPGERKSDVVLSIADEEITELHVTARLLFRKANPQFLELVFGFDTGIAAPVVELVTASHTIRVVAD